MLAPKAAKPKPETSVSRADERQRAAKSLRPSAPPTAGARANAWDVGRIALFPPESRQSGHSPNAAPIPGTLQAKLVVGAVDDPLEREADAVADKVMRMTDVDLAVSRAPLQVSRKCAECEDEDRNKLQMKPAAAAEPRTREAPGFVHNVLRSPGQPLDATARAYFEPRFGHDFSGVRVHTDSRAAASAGSIGASAYTAGSSIAFAEGRYSPATSSGRQLLAHELAHVVQQRALSPGEAFSEAALVQRFVGTDVLTSTVTQAMAEAMTDDELMQQIQLLRSHLQDQAEDAGATENLKTLEDVVRSRQAPAQATAAPAPNPATSTEAPPAAAAPSEAAPAEATSTPATPADATAAEAPPATSASELQTIDPNAAKPAPIGGVDVLSSTVTQATAEAMTDDEITRQIERLRSHLQDEPDDAGAKENLTTLESVFSSRQTSAPASSADASQPVEQADAQPLPADDAMSGVHFVFSVPSPRTEGTIDRFNMKRGVYLLVPQLRDKETDTPKVVYYIGYRTDAKRNEYVFGPDSLDLFTTNLDVFKTMGDTAFADPDVLDYIVGFGDAVWDQQGDIVTQYLSWLGVEDYQNLYAYFVQEGKRIRDEQRTRQQQQAKQTVAAKVLPLINAAMAAAAGARLLAGPRGAAISGSKAPVENIGEGEGAPQTGAKEVAPAGDEIPSEAPKTMGLQIPQGLSAEQFAEVGRIVYPKAAELGLGEDITVHGSRAAGTAAPSSDIDIKIRVSPEEFEDFLNNKSRLAKPNPGSSLEETRRMAVERGMIQRGEARLSSVGRQLETLLRIDVDLSVIRAGGPLDTTPEIPVPK